MNANAVYIADDVSHYATARRHKLERECARHRLDLALTPGLTVVPPAQLKPAQLKPAGAATTGSSPRTGGPGARPPGAGPTRCRGPSGCRPCRTQGASRPPAAAPPRAWPRAARRPAAQRFVRWRAGQLAGYDENHDDLAGDATSRLSAYLRFGCLSPLEVAIGALDRPSGEEFGRQLAWRDFFYQVTAAFPDIARKNYRPGAAWHHDDRALDAWRAGQTGIPIVDAGMRQLAAEGFMHNRARMVTASFLTRNLGMDWRHGYQHFGSLLADGDVACNAGNWQWVAGTGNNTRPNRVMNPLRQAQRFDSDGQYVRRYVAELAGLDPAWIQTPWKLPAAQRLGYPGPLVELS